MIDPKSAFFPVLGAAQAAGVSYAVACAWVEASRAPASVLRDEHAADQVETIWQAGVEQFGQAAMDDLCLRLLGAFAEGRITRPSASAVLAHRAVGGLTAEEQRLLDAWRHVGDDELLSLVERGDPSIEVRATRRRVVALRRRVWGG